MIILFSTSPTTEYYAIIMLEKGFIVYKDKADYDNNEGFFVKGIAEWEGNILPKYTAKIIK
jgi:hypothetical protein